MATIAEFLATIGFEADQKSMKAAFAQVAKFGAACAGLASAAVAGITRIAQSEAQLADDSKKLSVPAEKLEELRFVAEQTGTSADALTASLAGLKKANPGIKDVSLLLEKAARTIQGMNDAAAEAYAKKMGIDPALIPMLREDVAGLGNEYKELYAISGRNAAQAAEDGKAVMLEFGKLKSLLDLLLKTVAGAFLSKIRSSFELLRKTVIENFAKIKAALEIAIGIVLRIGDIIAAFAFRVIKFASSIIAWFDKLDSGQKKVIAGLALLLVAWKKLSLAFLKSPIGIVISALTTLFLLIDDYLTWAEGGDSLIDWSQHADEINTVISVLKVLWGVIEGLFAGIGNAVQPAIELFKSLFSTASDILKAIANLFTQIFLGDIQGVIDAFFALWSTVANAIKTVFLNLVNTIAAFFTGLWDSVTAAFPDFGAWASNAANSIKSFFGSAINWLKDRLKSLTGFLPDWIKKKIGLGDMADDKGDEAQSVQPDATASSHLANIRPVPNKPMLAPSPMQAEQTVNKNTEIKVDAKTEITVNGAQNPEAVAGKVNAAQNGHAADIARHTQGAVR